MLPKSKAVLDKLPHRQLEIATIVRIIDIFGASAKLKN